MKKTLFSPEQYYITNRQLWQNLVVPTGCGQNQQLKKAIRLGLSGKEKEGLSLLKNYYRTRTTGEWTDLCKASMENPPDTKLVRRLLNRDITLAHGMKVRFKDHIDFSSRQSGHDAMLWLQALGWMAPVVAHFARTSDPKARDFIVTTLDH